MVGETITNHFTDWELSDIIKVNKNAVQSVSITGYRGERKVIDPPFAPSTATETAMTYTYDQGNVITVDENGVIHALAAGTVTVTGTTGYGVSSTFVVNVIDLDFTNIKGDVNGDDQVNVVDLVRLKKHLAGAITLTGSDLSAADLNRDGDINSADLIILRKILLGIK